MTPIQEKEFIRLQQENAEFRKVLDDIRKGVSIVQKELGIDINEVTKIRSIEEAMTMIPRLIQNFQTNIGGIDEVKERFYFLGEIVPFLEKMTANNGIHESHKNLA